MKGQIASAALELQALSQHIQEQATVLMWCDSDHQLGKMLLSGVWRLKFDNAFISAQKRRNLLNTSEE